MRRALIVLVVDVAFWASEAVASALSGLFGAKTAYEKGREFAANYVERHGLTGALELLDETDASMLWGDYTDFDRGVEDAVRSFREKCDVDQARG